MAGFRHTLYFTSLFVIHLSVSLNEVSGAKNKKTTGQGLSYANFVADPFHYLNATGVGSSLVDDAVFCNIACVDNPSCLSFNVAAEPDIYGHLLCELLATDKYNSSDQFKENPGFHYYSLYVSSRFSTVRYSVRFVWLSFLCVFHVVQVKQLTKLVIRADALFRESVQEWRDLHPILLRRQLQVQMCCRLQRRDVRWR